jgi:hypothetical protein
VCFDGEELDAGLAFFFEDWEEELDPELAFFLRPGN